MRETQDFMFIQEIIAWETVNSKDLSGVKHVRLDMTARAKGKGAPDKGHTTSFSASKVAHYFPNFRSYFGMEYEQLWNMGKILLESSPLWIARWWIWGSYPAPIFSFPPQLKIMIDQKLIMDHSFTLVLIPWDFPNLLGMNGT